MDLSIFSVPILHQNLHLKGLISYIRGKSSDSFEFLDFDDDEIKDLFEHVDYNKSVGSDGIKGIPGQITQER